MSGPARAGALVYALDLERLAGFYVALLGMRRLHGDDEHVVLANGDFQLVVHAIPPEYARGIVIQSPPVPREDTAIKLFFTAPNLADAAGVALRLGGRLFDAEWEGPGFRARNGCDPEGNVFQLRERTSG
ncbi:MAG: VOC family protein [bacterium]